MNTQAADTQLSSTPLNNAHLHNTTDRTKPAHFDAIIVGGGLVGGLTALLLAPHKKVLLIDALPATTTQVLSKTDPRVLAISEASRWVYEAAGVWPLIVRQMPYKGMQTWTRDGRGMVEFGDISNTQYYNFSKHYGLGSMVEPAVINLAIQQVIETQNPPSLTALYQQKVTKAFSSLPQNKGVAFTQWTVETADCTQYTTPLLIAADGANSFIRAQANIGINVFDYQQVALTCAIKTENSHQQIARQVFLPEGPLGILPMVDVCVEHAKDDTGQWSSVVYSVPASLAQQYTQLNDEAWQKLLSQSMGYCLGQVIEVKSRAAFPLKARQAKTDVMEGLVLVGDAAHVIHPLAGQGVNLGILDVAVLVDMLLNDDARGLWAHIQTLNRYSAARKLHTATIMHSMTAIGWMQRQQNPLLAWARAEGTHVLSKLPWVRQKLADVASGMFVLNKTRFKNVVQTLS